MKKNNFNKKHVDVRERREKERADSVVTLAPLSAGRFLSTQGDQKVVRLLFRRKGLRFMCNTPQLVSKSYDWLWTPCEAENIYRISKK
jgi:hypothetical protein